MPAPTPVVTPVPAPGKPWRLIPRDPIFHFYSRGTELNHFLRRRIRPLGIGVMISIVISAGIAAGNTDGSVYLTFAMACSLVAVGLLDRA
jgi:hypothetical protein